MVSLLYNLGIRWYGLAIRIASLFNQKAKLWVEGRRDIFTKIEKELDPSHKILWFHAASLGEAEQGLPIIKKLRPSFPQHRVLLTFFSPSGMINFKSHKDVDYCFYLPLDTRKNAKKFIQSCRPDLAFFIKYEIWPNFFSEIGQQSIPLIVAPANFRSDQIYFKWPVHQFFLDILRKVDFILTQDQRSAQLLRKYGLEKVEVAGDSRFDRVIENVNSAFSDKLIEQFSRDSQVMIGGSTWPKDEQLIKAVFEHQHNLKFIIAPHDISERNVRRVESYFGVKNVMRYSEGIFQPTKRILLIDNIGLLSKIYRFGALAYIGGAFGEGIHNSLEAAAYGMPVFFGPRHEKFIEPGEMIDKGFAHEVLNEQDLVTLVEELMTDSSKLHLESTLAREYVLSKSGAVDKIYAVVKDLIRGS